MEIRLNAHGELIEPGLHDGYAESLAVDRDSNSVLLKCISQDGKSVLFRFAGILAFKGNNFKEGNIINEVTFFCGAAIPKKMISEMLTGTKDKTVDDFAKELERTGSLFIHLTPSYGLELKVICKDVSIEP